MNIDEVVAASPHSQPYQVYFSFRAAFISAFQVGALLRLKNLICDDPGSRGG